MGRRAVSALGEEGLLGLIFRRLRPTGRGIILGPGDDAAAIRVPKGACLVASQDDLVEGTHFERRWADPRRLAHRLVAVNASDLAAMGDVRPLGCLVSASLAPGLPVSWFRLFLRGMAEASSRWGVPVLGGNLTRSQRLFFSCSIFGSAVPTRLVRRRGARPGDILGGVGPLGQAAAGLALLRSGRPVPLWARSLRDSFWEPKPQLEAARRLTGLLSSLMDNSDGLARSARILAAASGVGARISLSEAPVSPALRRWCREGKRDVARQQLVGGEDYGLVFTAPRRHWERVVRRVPEAYRLGEIVPGKGVRLAGSSGPGTWEAFEHFR